MLHTQLEIPSCLGYVTKDLTQGNDAQAKIMLFYHLTLLSNTNLIFEWYLLRIGFLG